MNFSDYDQFIIQKYRLAVAIAFIKMKPPYKTIEEFLNETKANIDKTISDDDVTICESDFDIDENDATVYGNNENSNDSVTILKNFDENFYNDTLNNPTTPLLDVIRTLNNIESENENFETENNLPLTQENSQNTLNDNIIKHTQNRIDNYETVNVTQINSTDSQKTIIYTVNANAEHTHISQSQDNFVVSKDLLIKNKNKNSNSNSNPIIIKDFIKEATKRKLNENNTKASQVLTYNDMLITQFSYQNNESDKQLEISHYDLLNNRNKQKTIDNSNKNQENNKEINIMKTKDVNNTYSMDEFEYYTAGGDVDSMIQNDNETGFCKRMHDSNDNDNANNKFDTDLSQKGNYSNKDIINSDDQNDSNDNRKATNKFDTDLSQKGNDFDNRIMNSDNQNDSNDNDNIIIDEDLNDSSDDIPDLTESQAELVTFKVLEELSKVKNYLNRRERLNTSDSGYRSFQKCTGDNSSQGTSSWLNQSAHCLTNFIITNPLVMKTVEITDEISIVLGKLIDRLHEDEIYPKFLEEILEAVKKLLIAIHEGRNYGEDMLNKDEMIQRLMLLNRSIHIVKYTIEKITNVLEKTIEYFNNTHELVNIDESENICYIFYILEDLLKRNNKLNIVTSQTSSQQSQDEKILKKSSLTEIWRRKWNLTNDKVSEGSFEKKCALIQCGDVLNSIIVSAMDGYSLISFAALQCFNLLQN